MCGKGMTSESFFPKNWVLPPNISTYLRANGFRLIDLWSILPAKCLSKAVKVPESRSFRVLNERKM